MIVWIAHCGLSSLTITEAIAWYGKFMFLIRSSEGKFISKAPTCKALKRTQIEYTEYLELGTWLLIWNCEDAGSGLDKNEIK